MKPLKILVFQSEIKKYTCILLLLFLYVSCNFVHPQEKNFSVLRNKMVDEQIAARGISDESILNVMKKVERHLFVPPSQINFAYEDRPLEIGYGQTISQPFIVAYMTQIVALEKTSKVLEIGTGSGYQAAILAELCDSVYTIEIIPELGLKADSLLKKLNYNNVKVKIGDGYKGWPEHASFDAIIVTCAPTQVPEPLKEQLAEGGRMIIPVGPQNKVQELILLRKKNNRLIQKSIFPVRFVPMMEEENKGY